MRDSTSPARHLWDNHQRDKINREDMPHLGGPLAIPHRDTIQTRWTRPQIKRAQDSRWSETPTERHTRLHFHQGEGPDKAEEEDSAGT